MTISRSLGPLMLLLLSTLTPAAQAPENSQAVLNAEAIKAYQAKDYAKFVALEKRALELAPGTPRLIYNLACGEALQGNAQEAVQLLNQLLARKLDLGADKDDDFAGIHGTAEWRGFTARLQDLRKPLVRSHEAFRLAQPGLMATGMAVDPKTGDTYIASVRERKIIRRTRQGMVSDFIASAQDGFLAGDSLIIDPARRILFASTAAPLFMAGYRKEDQGQSGVFAFSLKSGKLLTKALLHADGKPHFLNALALDHEGNLYVSDSAEAGVYRLRREGSKLEMFLPGDAFRSTQGLAFSDDGKTLFVADFIDGIWAVDMATKQRRHLDAPADVWLGSLDGLSRVPGGFIAVQIAPVRPERVLRLRFDAHVQKIAAVEVLEMNHPEYSGPIQGVVSGGEFLYVANSQLDLGNGQTGAFDQKRARPTVVLRLPL